jgi:hypothetical protein
MNLPSDVLLAPLAERLFDLLTTLPDQAIAAHAAALLRAIGQLDLRCCRAAGRWLADKLLSFCELVSVVSVYTRSRSTVVAS